MRYWIIVASKDHVQVGNEGGFCQTCHGKKWPLEKMSPGDGILFYSSKKQLGDSKPYQKFTAVGKVSGSPVYRASLENDFKPYRRDVTFMNCREVEIHPLLDRLHLVQRSKNWGYSLRKGFLEIDRHDFGLIARRMLNSSEFRNPGSGLVYGNANQ